MPEEEYFDMENLKMKITGPEISEEQSEYITSIATDIYKSLPFNMTDKMLNFMSNEANNFHNNSANPTTLLFAVLMFHLHQNIKAEVREPNKISIPNIKL